MIGHIPLTYLCNSDENFRHFYIGELGGYVLPCLPKFKIMILVILGRILLTLGYDIQEARAAPHIPHIFVSQSFQQLCKLLL